MKKEFCNMRCLERTRVDFLQGDKSFIDLVAQIYKPEFKLVDLQ